MSTSPVRAAVSWARMCEPSDKVAAALIAALGQQEGLLLAQEFMASPRRLESHISQFSQLEELGVPVISRHLRRWALRTLELDPDQELRQAKLLNAHVLYPESEHWPNLIDDLGPAVPFALWVRGDLGALEAQRRTIAVVGSRASTAYGEHATAVVLSALSTRSDVVVSGGAFGVDANAHAQALAKGLPTVAVMAGGVDRLYPAGNQRLLSRIASGEHGSAVISESPPGTLPMKSRFLSRNRIIAGLSHATVVIEAAWRSGSLSTAHHALEIGRAVGAVPGPITSAQSAGCHRLVQESGAQLVTCAQDINELLGAHSHIEGGHLRRLESAGAPGEHVSSTTSDVLGEAPKGGVVHLPSVTSGALRVLDGFRRSGMSTITELAHRTGLLETEVLVCLGELEIAGLVTRDLFGWSRKG